MNRSRVEGFVYPVAKTHQFLFTGQLIFCKLYRIGVFTLFFQSKKGIHNRSVCTSVERAFKSSDCSCDGRVHIRLGCTDGAAGKGRGIHPVLGVQHQAEIHGSFGCTSRTLAVQHIEEVVGSTSLIKGLYNLQAFSGTVEGSNDDRHLCSQGDGVFAFFWNLPQNQPAWRRHFSEQPSVQHPCWCSLYTLEPVSKVFCFYSGPIYVLSVRFGSEAGHSRAENRPLQMWHALPGCLYGILHRSDHTTVHR